MKLQGRTALVTGAGRGIGAAIAAALAAEGARVYLVARTRSELDAVASGIRARGGRAEVFTGDAAAPADVARITSAALEAGGVDVLVNNAGVYGPIGPFVETNLDEWWRALEVNLRSALLFSRALAPGMIAARRGKIINLSGGGATTPLPNLTLYSVSKTAVVRFTETLAVELRPHNVQVNAIAPGAVDTRLQDDLLAAGDRAGADLHGRIRALRETGAGGVPASVPAALALWLASDDSGTLTGKLISAPHDPWRDWGSAGDELSASPMYTLRRLDPHTLRPLKDKI
jgi:NAD(P)-dependent dehydrogenase (short-subunit alcohol dehydrogenase family)